MVAWPEGGAAAARAAIESCWAGATQVNLRLPPFASFPHCTARHTTTAHPRHAQRLIRRCTPPPSREIEMVAAWRRRLLRPGQHCCKSCAGAVRGGLAGTGCGHTKTGKSRSGPFATRGAPGSLPGAHSGGLKLLWRAWQKCGALFICVHIRETERTDIQLTDVRTCQILAFEHLLGANQDEMLSENH